MLTVLPFRRRGRRASDIFPAWLRLVIMFVLLGSILAVLAYMVDLSLASSTEISGGIIVPHHLDFQNYVQMWQGTGLLEGLKNSTLICGVTAVASVLVGGTAGYVLARLPFRGRSVLLSALLAFQAVPILMAILPLFMVMVWVQSLLHLTITGTYWSVIIAYLTFSLPLVTWLVKSYVENVPIELEEAARLDGAGAFRVLSRVVLPIAAPAAVIAAVLAFLTGWGDLLVATILTSPSSQTVTVALNAFLNVQESSTTVPAYGMLLAASVVSALPVVVIFLSLQRFFVAGLAGSAMKG